MGRVSRRTAIVKKAATAQPKPRGRPPRVSQPALPEAAAETAVLMNCEYSADAERLTFHLRSRESYTITLADSSPEHFWGTIYSAEWRHPDHPNVCDCAIKASDFQLSHNKADDTRAEYRRPRNDFDREVRTFQSTGHHNVLQMYGFWEWDGRGYIALKRMKGSLGDVLYDDAYQNIVQSLRLDESILAELARQILTGLDHLHSKNIIYRDLKPDNLLISYRPRMKLADFGNVHFLPSSDTVTRGLEGTVSYMSPEMRMGRYYNTRTDIWSFGITMLNLLFDNNTTFPNFELAGPWAARKFAQEQSYLSTELKMFMQSLFLKASERPSTRELLNHPFLKKASNTAFKRLFLTFPPQHLALPVLSNRVKPATPPPTPASKSISPLDFICDSTQELPSPTQLTPPVTPSPSPHEKVTLRIVLKRRIDDASHELMIPNTPSAKRRSKRLVR